MSPHKLKYKPSTLSLGDDFFLMQSFKEVKTGPGGMDQQLRAPAASPQDLSSVPSTQVAGS